MNPKRVIAIEGLHAIVAFACDKSGGCPGADFFDELPTSDKAKVLRLLQHLAEGMPTNNGEKFGNLAQGLFEIKSFQIRMPYAHAANEKNVILVTHGFFKKKDKAPKNEIERAKRILQEDEEIAKHFSIAERKTDKRTK